MRDGVEAELLGYVAREFLKLGGIYENKLAQVTKLYSDSRNSHERAVSHQRNGVCLCIKLSVIQLDNFCLDTSLSTKFSSTMCRTQYFFKWSLNGLFTPTSSGCIFEVEPGGIMLTRHERERIALTTEGTLCEV